MYTGIMTCIHYYSIIQNTDVPGLWWFNLMIFWLYNGVKANKHSVGTELWILIFSWASVMLASTLWCYWAAGVSHSSSQHMITRVNNWYIYNHLYPYNHSLFFTSSTVFNKLHERVNTLLYNRLCVGWFCPTAD